MLQFEGAEGFRQRIILSTLSGKPVVISKIRADIDEDHIGLKDYEISFLKLIEKATNGCTIEINHTGTAVTYKPGNIIGGRIEHDCGTERSITYFLEGLVALAPFAKKPFYECVLKGITNDCVDMSVDLVRSCLLPQLKRFFGYNSDEFSGAELKIRKRGVYPLGGGEVVFSCPIARSVKPFVFLDEGRIMRIRGTAFVSKLSPVVANRCIESARSLLNKFIPDVYIYTDTSKGSESGKSPGFGLSLVAESTTGVLLSADFCAKPGQTPEELGVECAKLLYHQISIGGCCDAMHQWLYILFMALSPEDVSKMKFGKLSEFTIKYFRDVQKILGIKFNVKADPDNEDRVLLTSVGIGYTNLNKAVK